MTYRSKTYKEPTDVVGHVAELFAGVGGFRIGLSRAGWKTTFSNQWEPSTKVQHASDVYVARFGSKGHSNVDIAHLESIPKNIDLLVGGFPCQDYSVAKTLNSAKGLKGKKGVLWWEILRLVENQKPKFIFLENVDRLLKSPSTQRGRDFAVMLKTLGGVGYEIEWRVVNAADYGFPQRRIRVFIVATKIQKKSKSQDHRNILSKTGILARALPIESPIIMPRAPKILHIKPDTCFVVV
jgi:DNA (cytosine-5)-methyltransferase 1